MAKIKKIIHYIISAVILLVALLLIISIFPITGNIKVLTVLSGSMEPEIHTGSVVVIKPVTNYRIGNIITFGSNTKTQVPTTHRIVETRLQDGQTVYKTQGDANNGEDLKEVENKDIIGKVYFSVPYAGFLVDFIKRPIGLILVIMIPAAAIIFDEIKKIIKEIKKLKSKSDNFKENV